MYYHTIYIPMPCSDEDAPPIARKQMLAVADGLGGRGGRQLTDADGSVRTNAYVASRISIRALEGLFTSKWINVCFDALSRADARSQAEDEENAGAEDSAAEQTKEMVPDRDEILAEVANEAARAIHEALNRWWAENVTKEWVKSGAFKRLPTTVAVILFREYASWVDTISIWCGDSRCYALNLNGLMQLSNDHLQGEPDYQQILHCDGMMSQMVNLSDPYRLCVRRARIKKPCVLFTASDGAFMYTHSNITNHQPNALQLEYILLSRLNTEKLALGLEKLQNTFLAHLQDDTTLAMGFFADNYAQFLKMIRLRGSAFAKRYSKEWSMQKPKYLDVTFLGRAAAVLERAKITYRNEILEVLPGLIEAGHPLLQKNELYTETVRGAEEQTEQIAQRRANLQTAVEKNRDAFIRAFVAVWPELRAIDPEQIDPTVLPYIHADLDPSIGVKIKRLKKSCHRIVWRGHCGDVFFEKRIRQLKKMRSEVERLNSALTRSAHKIELVIPWHVQGPSCRIPTDAKNGLRRRSTRLMDDCVHTILHCIGENAELLYDAMAEDEGRCGFCRLVPELNCLYDELLGLFEERKALDQAVVCLRHEKIEELVSEHGEELADWLVEMEHKSGPAYEVFAKCEVEYEAAFRLHALYDEQWKEYKKIYEHYLRVPCVSSEWMRTC